ncbi:MAG: NfeD family protein [Clostridia bacterium]|nr:NfeD family protein [Clostridia bacterium]
MFNLAALGPYMIWVWLGLAVVFGIVEAMTVGLTTIWFAAGSLCAMVLAILGVGLPLQIAVFFLVSIVLLATTRKIFVNKLKTGSEKTNVETLIGEEGRVTSTIIPLNSGRVEVRGQDWAAVAVGKNDLIPEGAVVIVKAIDGVKLVVDVKESAPEA